jgi:hypothetical protein
LIFDPGSPINQGHAVVIKNIFEWISEKDNLGKFYLFLKNQWSEKWGINGSCIMPIKTIPYLGIFIIILVEPHAVTREITEALFAPIQEPEARPPAARQPAARRPAKECLPDPILIGLPQPRRQRRVPVWSHGGKRCNRSRKRRKITHKRNYRRSGRRKSRVQRRKSRVQRRKSRVQGRSGRIEKNSKEIFSELKSE